MRESDLEFHSSIEVNSDGELRSHESGLIHPFTCDDTRFKFYGWPGNRSHDTLYPGDELLYTVTFYNNNTHVDVQDVRVAFELDHDLDFNTMRLVNSSHPMELEGVDGHMIALFDSIGLAPGDYGYFSYAVRMKGYRSSGTFITGVAHVTFDQGPPWMTNNLLHVYDLPPEITDPAFGGDNFYLYPNPTTGEFNIKVQEEIPDGSTIKIYDMTGAELYSSAISGTNIEAVVDLQSGVYLVQMIDPNGKSIGVEQLVVTR